MKRMTPAVFELVHPAVTLLWFASVLVLTMAAMQPVYTAIALVGSLACRAGIDGMRQALRAVLWLLPVIAVIACANCAFVASGSTVLFHIGSRAFYAEALCYGACSGAMLAAVLLEFGNASRVLTSEKVLGVFGNVLPTVGLMSCMTMRLVPQFARRGRIIGDATRACTAACGQAGETGTARQRRLAHNMRLASVLMGWGMQDALERADCMRARGWGEARARTTYVRRSFRAADALACTAVGILAAGSAVCAYGACSAFAFYPTFGGLVPAASYAPFAVLVLLPLLAAAALHTRRNDV